MFCGDVIERLTCISLVLGECYSTMSERVCDMYSGTQSAMEIDIDTQTSCLIHSQYFNAGLGGDRCGRFYLPV